MIFRKLRLLGIRQAGTGWTGAVTGSGQRGFLPCSEVRSRMRERLSSVECEDGQKSDGAVRQLHETENRSCRNPFGRVRIVNIELARAFGKFATGFQIECYASSRIRLSHAAGVLPSIFLKARKNVERERNPHSA